MSFFVLKLHMSFSRKSAALKGKYRYQENMHARGTE